MRAVVLDYGMVLSGPPNPDSHAALVRITGLHPDRFESLYWADRHALDSGTLNGRTYWQKIGRDGGLNLSESEIEELIRVDARMWMDVNPAMLEWQLKLKEHGLKTAIVSNMGDTNHQAVQREFAWLARFDVLVWSYELLLAKPDPAIYRYVLEKLGTRAEETLFIDDKPENIATARDLGMIGIVFTTAAQLRSDLIATGLDSALPLP